MLLAVPFTCLGVLTVQVVLLGSTRPRVGTLGRAVDVRLGVLVVPVLPVAALARAGLFVFLMYASAIILSISITTVTLEPVPPASSTLLTVPPVLEMFLLLPVQVAHLLVLS